MIPFPTSPQDLTLLKGIATEMVRADLDFDWVVAVESLAKVDEGAFDLMKLWHDSEDKGIKEQVVADLQDTLDDYADAPSVPTQRPRIPFDDLDSVTRRVLAEKKKLRELIDRHGGISAVAKKSGIPQPSLSRLLKSASMPRRSTLYKIAVALGVPEKEVAMEWTR